MPESKPLGKLIAWKCPPDSAAWVDGLPHLTGAWVGALLDESGTCVATVNKEWHPVILAAVNSRAVLMGQLDSALAFIAEVHDMADAPRFTDRAGWAGRSAAILKSGRAALAAAKQGASDA